MVYIVIALRTNIKMQIMAWHVTAYTLEHHIQVNLSLMENRTTLELGFTIACGVHVDAIVHHKGKLKA